jgi:transcriptional regulator
VRPNPLHAADDPEVVRRLIREYLWGTLVSNNDGELVPSHYPILLDDDAEGIAGSESRFYCLARHTDRPSRRSTRT